MDLDQQEPNTGKPNATRVYSRNVLISALRLGVIAGSGVLLPYYLTHHLIASTYSGWVLTLQIASYVGYLEFGMTTAVSKYVAQHGDSPDLELCNQHASAGVAISLVSGLIGFILSAILAL